MTDSLNPIIPEPIELGTILFTMVEPHKGHEVAYNRWYERDHFYSGCLAGPYLFAGSRWVATRNLKAQRFPESSPITPDPTVGSYLAIYWVLKGTHDAWNRWSVDQVQMLHKSGRMFQQRDHIHTVLYEYQWTHSRDEDGVPVELALDHPYEGMVAMIGECNEGGDLDEVDRWWREQHLPGALAGGPIAMTAAFRPMPLLDDAPADVPREEGVDRRFLHIYFCESEPLAVWNTIRAAGEAYDGSGLGRILWASPFLPTLPGTDIYTDQLW